MVDWGKALLVAVLGLSIVFIVLALIMFILIIMEKIFAPKNKEEPKQSVKQEVQKPKQTSKQESLNKKDDTELIAVLTAAVAACLSATSPSGVSTKFKIKSYRKLGDTNSAWNNASRKENIYSRF